jgi:hypothetical protein
MQVSIFRVNRISVQLRCASASFLVLISPQDRRHASSRLARHRPLDPAIQ